MVPEHLMAMAVEKCREGIAAGQTPFGCVIARGDEILAVAHNVVLAATDITAHAEVAAIRIACRQTGQILLEDAIVATTCEPCPMCMAALHWARVKTVYYGASIGDASLAGFNELQLPAAELLRIGNSPVELVGGVLAEDCRELFAQWQATARRESY